MSGRSGKTVRKRKEKRSKAVITEDRVQDENGSDKAMKKKVILAEETKGVGRNE